MQGIAKDPIKDKRHTHPKLDTDINPLPGEVWKDVLEWKGRQLQTGYQVSNLGRIRNVGRVIEQIGRNGKIIKHPYPACMMRLTKDEDGYLFTNFCCIDRKCHVTARVHQVVATYFLDTVPRHDQTHVNHIDGNKENNLPSNLEWASPDENNRHARKIGLARLGTSQAIRARIIEYDEILSSKTKLNKRLGRCAGYVEYRLAHNMPIIDTTNGQEVHVEWLGILKEDRNER